MDHRPHSPAAVVGAGPYGVSIAAHLKAARIDFRIFGKPMYRWQSQMPKGMFLKSEGCASNLSDPAGHFTLERFCTQKGLPYGARGAPVSLDVFTQYALAFQRHLAPGVEDLMVTRIDKSGDTFNLQLSDGTIAKADKVILATGLEHAVHVPRELAGLPSELMSHCVDHHNLTRFKGSDVTVIGGGQSALETAALLAEEGASVRLLVRKSSLVWNALPRTSPRSLYARLRHPQSNLGEGLGLWAYCNAPNLFRRLPRRTRLERARAELGPAGAWWLKERIIGRVQILLSHSVVKAEARGARAALQIGAPDGRVLNLSTDHVIAATGYRFDLSRLPFLSQTLKSQVRTEEHLPILSSSYESSVPGLYFSGVASMYSFGPAMRFLVGADYTARRISGHLALQRRHSASQSAVPFSHAPVQ